MSLVILDCTLRDGGYYNDWNFSKNVTNEYLESMHAAGVNVVELGLRSLINKGFKGANAYTTDKYLSTLSIPSGLKVAVMINASEFNSGLSIDGVLSSLFAQDKSESVVDIVRIACHVHEFSAALEATTWLKSRGYTVGFNLMQVADRSQQEIEQLAYQAAQYPLDVLYFADSMGSMDPEQTGLIVTWLRKHWTGPLGIHTHDNMGLALQNTLHAIKEGVSWLDSTVTGMGRGPGNSRTEELVIEVSELENRPINIVPLLAIIRNFFQPLKNKCGWGSNPYYFLSGKYGIHPTYIQEMLGDSRYSEEDIIAAINHLKIEGGKKFTFNTLDAARNFYQGEAAGTWSPESLLSGREVLILGSGPGVAEHRAAIESYIVAGKPVVIALNTQSSISQSLIDLRVACHPVRLLADCEAHTKLPQPLITPASMLPADVRNALSGKELFDFGLTVSPAKFEFNENTAVLPNSLVLSYALAIAISGRSANILLAGFDGYGADDPRTSEVQNLIKLFMASVDTKVFSITPTSYDWPARSVYAMQGV